MQSITKLPATTGSEPSTADLDGWVKTEGNPSMKTWVLHTSKDGAMVSGIWECSPGSYHATYTAYEYVVLIEGRIVITPEFTKWVLHYGRKVKVICPSHLAAEVRAEHLAAAAQY